MLYFQPVGDRGVLMQMFAMMTHFKMRNGIGEGLYVLPSGPKGSYRRCEYFLQERIRVSSE